MQILDYCLQGMNHEITVQVFERLYSQVEDPAVVRK
jgi:hypothetical protein